MEVGGFEVLATLISFAVGLVGASKYYKKFKKVVVEGAEVVEDVSSLMSTIKTALADDNLTKEEVREIFEKSQDVVEEFNEFVVSVKELVK